MNRAGMKKKQLHKIKLSIQTVDIVCWFFIFIIRSWYCSSRSRSKKLDKIIEAMLLFMFFLEELDKSFFRTQ
jgi:hypothetical protein